MKKIILIIIVLLLALSIFVYIKEEKQDNHVQKLLPPEKGVYISAFPDFNNSEDNVTAEKVIDFEKIVNKPIVWAPLSDNWGKSNITFPENSVKILHEQNVIPYIRMMPRNDIDASYESTSADPVFSLKRIVNGDFDDKLKKWAIDAKNSNTPLIIDFAPEMNGDWFPWSGKYNGKDTKDKYGDPNLADGPEIYRDAYRHIIDIFNEEGATNVTWVFHVNSDSFPAESWNNYSAYYPGDEYIDWIGVSSYGAITPDEDWENFTDIMDKSYPELESVSKTKPLAVLEFGVMERNDGQKAVWIHDALQSIENGRYPRIKAISYWHESWVNSDESISNLRLDSSKEALETYKKDIESPFFVSKANFTN